MYRVDLMLCRNLSGGCLHLDAFAAQVYIVRDTEGEWCETTSFHVFGLHPTCSSSLQSQKTALCSFCTLSHSIYSPLCVSSCSRLCSSIIVYCCGSNPFWLSQTAWPNCSTGALQTPHLSTSLFYWLEMFFNLRLTACLIRVLCGTQPCKADPRP